LIGISNVRIEPEKNALVTLIWPSMILYNRVGFCNITLSSAQINAEKVDTKRDVVFNTSINPNALSDPLIGNFNNLQFNGFFRFCMFQFISTI
jgi:hypothetical protein